MIRAGALAALVLLLGCGARQTGRSRQQWLADQLLARHAELLARDPQAVADKLARMARSRFTYFRASAALMPEQPSRFVTAGASRVAVLGDPHPENIGTFPVGQGGLADAIVDFNDFDLAGHGSYVLDLRRLALGLWLAGDMADVSKKQRVRLVESVCEGYLDEIANQRAGRPPISLVAGTAFDGGLEEILARPDQLQDGDGKSVGDGKDGNDDKDDGEDDGTGPVEPAEQARLAEALLAYRRTLLNARTAPPSALAIQRAVRARAGISSYPILRFRIRVAGPGPTPEDDWTLELKESWGRPAEAIVRLQRSMQARPDLDPLLGWTSVEGRQMRVRQLSSSHRRLSVERLVKAVKSPRWGKKDLRSLARDTGRLLARAHGRAPTADGQSGAQVIAEAATDRRGLIYETVQVTGEAAQVVEQDLDLLRELLKQRGPLLGWQPAR